MSIIPVSLKENRIQFTPTTLGVAALAGTLILHASFSSPFPNSLTVFEAIVSIALVALVIFSTVQGLRLGNIPNYLVSWLLFFGFFGVFHAVYGLMKGHLLQDIVRDVLAMLFFSLCLITRPLIVSLTKTQWKIIISSALAAGCIFGIRYHFMAPGTPLDRLTNRFIDWPIYITQDPVTIFAFVFFAFAILNWSQLSARKIGVLCVYFLLLSLLGLAFIGVNLRYPIFVTAMLLLLYTFLNESHLWRTLIVATLAGFLSIIFADLLFQIFGDLIEKTREVGANRKVAEFLHVFGRNAAWSEVLFGVGNGALINAGVYSSIEVSYTHNFFSYFYWKYGLVGLVIGGYIFCSACLKALHLARVDVPVGLAILSVLGFGLLQPTFKTLTFGLILGLTNWYYRVNRG